MSRHEADVRLLEGKTCVVTEAGSGVGRSSAVLFLASDLSANTTGAIIPVDGGYLAR